MNLIDAGAEVVQGALLIHMDQHHEGVALARGILFLLKECVDQLRCVRNQEVKIPEVKEGKQGIQMLGRSTLQSMIDFFNEGTNRELIKKGKNY